MSARFWKKVDIRAPFECWEWRGSRYWTGYGETYYKGKRYLAHRVALELSGGAAVGGGHHVLHSCDNPVCVNPAHLRAGTNLDNVRDRQARNPRFGEANPNTYFNEIAVRVICYLHDHGTSVRRPAAAYKIPTWTIFNVLRGRSWAHVTGRALNTSLRARRRHLAQAD